MFGIFEFFGSILGYLLWALFTLFKNFGVSIIIFTIVVKVILFPFSVKQQKSMANTMRLQKKQRELQKKYADNRVKMNEEMQKLYQKEGVSPTGGCLTSIIPLFLMLGVFYSVAYPLTNTLHISKEQVKSATACVETIPGYSMYNDISLGKTKTYAEINLVSYLNEIDESKAEEDVDIVYYLFEKDADNVRSFINSFNFAGFNLLTIPQSKGMMSVYFLIPVLCFVTSVGSQIITMKLTGSGANQQGCMKLMIYGLPLFSAWIAYIAPSAMGFYWISSSILGLVQSLIMNKFYGPAIVIARGEAQHVALLELKEKENN